MIPSRAYAIAAIEKARAKVVPGDDDLLVQLIAARADVLVLAGMVIALSLDTDE